MSVQYRTDLKNYALRSLGQGALQINVTPEQIEDRIDEALQRYWEFHHEGSDPQFIYHVLTQAEVDNKQIELTPNVYQVLCVLPLGWHYSQVNLEWVAYFQALGDSFIVKDGGLVNYSVGMSYLKLLQDTVGRSEMVHFNQRHNILYLYNDLYNYKVGDTMILHAYLYTDPDTFNEVWTDQWLRDYTAALIKRQWGQNMLKYDGFQLPSGMTLNGREIYQDALNDIERLNERLQNEETLPPDMMWG